MARVFKTNYNHKGPTPDKACGPSRVDIIGYQPFQKRIELMLSVGQNVQALKAEQFDYPDGKLPSDFAPHPILSEKLDKMHHAIPQANMMRDYKRAVSKLQKAQVDKDKAKAGETPAAPVSPSGEAPKVPEPNKV